MGDESLRGSSGSDDFGPKQELRQRRVLVTGASGYIGGRLVPELLTRGYRVRAMVRGDPLEYQKRWPQAEIAVADALNERAEALEKALEGVDTAFYLLHSLYLGPKVFEAADIKAARHFREASQKQNVKRIIYLGGLGDIRSRLSRHLRSRMEVAEELKRGQVPVTILRAGIIIGSGSASYEIIQHLVRRLRLIPMPYWSKNKCQPISIRDVIRYLVGTLEVPQTAGGNFDIGGPDILTYQEMLAILSQTLREKRFFIPFPFLGIRVFSYLASLITPVPAPITQCLMEGLRNEVICQEQRIKEYLPFEPLSYREAVTRALSREEQDKVRTRWSDAYPPAHTLSVKLHELQPPPRYQTCYSLKTEKEAASLFRSLCHIGGRQGWFENNWLWRLRGMVDRLLGGVGSSRGRRSYRGLKVNDVIDFWRIEDFREGQRLLLRAEMKLPGKAWLEFNIQPVPDGRKLSVTAYYDAQGFWGVIYWYACLPFHYVIFKELIAAIEKRS